MQIFGQHPFLAQYVLPAFVASIVIAVFSVLRNIWVARMRFRTLISKGMPVPPGHSFLLGHLRFYNTVKATLPKDAHHNYVFGEIGRRWFSKEGAYYIDLWPFSEPLLVVLSGVLATQATQTLTRIATQKPHQLRAWFRPITGGPNLVEMPEAEWRPWRAVFNKGFSAVHVQSLVPGMVDEARVYCDILRRHARAGGMFSLDAITMRFIMDLIGRTVLNARLHAQKGYHPLADSMMSQIKWHVSSKSLNPFTYVNVVRWVIQWLNARRMVSFIGKELDQRYSEYRADTANTRSKAVMDLVLQAYLASHVTHTSMSSLKASSETDAAHAADTKPAHVYAVNACADRLDPAFRDFATSQVRLFFFGGYDSTSSAICHLIHLLSTHPAALARVRAEHDAVFGRDLARVPDIVASEPQRLHELPYSLAVIKETLRLFPPAAAVRRGCHGTDLVSATALPSHNHTNGSGGGGGASSDSASASASLSSSAAARYPTEHMSIWIQHPAIHRLPENHWARGDDFVPERWLAAPGDVLHVDATARASWRPFEHGPRNCIGQALVLLELRVVLVLVAREFAFAPAYAEWDAQQPPRRLARLKGAVRCVGGERAYQVEAGAAHPADGYPCRVAVNPDYAEQQRT